MNEQTAPEWRDCADPDELAAAVAAGVEDDPKGCPSCGLHWADGQIETVCAAPRGGGYHRVCHACGAEWDDSRFGYGVKEAYLRSQPPTSWTWRPEPPAPDDLAARATDECTLSPDRVGSPAGNDHPVTIPPADDLRERLRLGIEDAVNDYADVVMDIMDAEVVRHAGWLAARLEEADAERTTLRHRLVETMPTTPPDGCEAVFMPTGLVDEWCERVGMTATMDVDTIDACREAQARRGTTPAPPPAPPWPGAETHDAGVHLGPLADCLQCQPHDLGGGAGNREDRACVGDVSYPSPQQGVTPPPGHTTTDDCWCDPTVEVVDGADGRVIVYNPDGVWTTDQLRDLWLNITPGSSPERVAAALWAADWIDWLEDELHRTSSAHEAALLRLRAAEVARDDLKRWADDLAKTTANDRERPETTAPPWPGAVLSGLCDEDGVPTWLAQAGNVQGESVRTCADFPWFVCGSDNASDRTWVEVRAPRAVPEPETERVPWWDALGRTDPNDGPIVAVEHLADRSPRVYFDPQSWMDATHPDGTVEVIKGGDR